MKQNIKYAIVANKFYDCVPKEIIERDALALLNKFAPAVKFIKIETVPMESVKTRKTLFRKREVPAEKWIQYRAAIDVGDMTEANQAILKGLFEAFVMGRLSAKKW